MKNPNWLYRCWCSLNKNTVRGLKHLFHNQAFALFGITWPAGILHALQFYCFLFIVPANRGSVTGVLTREIRLNFKVCVFIRSEALQANHAKPTTEGGGHSQGLLGLQRWKRYLYGNKQILNITLWSSCFNFCVKVIVNFLHCTIVEVIKLIDFFAIENSVQWQ